MPADLELIAQNSVMFVYIGKLAVVVVVCVCGFIWSDQLSALMMFDVKATDACREKDERTELVCVLVCNRWWIL